LVRWTNKGINLTEGTFIYQQVDPLAGGQPAALVLGFNALQSAPFASFGSAGYAAAQFWFCRSCISPEKVRAGAREYPENQA
jgi:hypothetical protein